MNDFIRKLLDKFHNPIIFLFFLLGTILILLAVSQGLTIPGLENVVSEPSYRVTSLVIGILFVFFSLLVSLKDPLLPPDLATELRKPLAQRRVNISEKQEKILRYIEQTYQQDSQKIITQEDIIQVFNMSGSEVYYRLEQLLLLGFILKKHQNEINSYHLSRDHKKVFFPSSTGKKVR